MDEKETRWNINSVAGKQLTKFILDNKIHQLKPGDKRKPQPKDIWARFPIFQQYKKENFRTNYNRLIEKLREDYLAEEEMKELTGMSGK